MSPTFMESLAANPSSGIYQQPRQDNTGETLNIVNQLKDRELSDFRQKADFMSNLSLKQERLRRMYENEDNANMQPQQQNMNTVMGQDPGAINPMQKAELGIRQQGMNLESQKLAQQGKFSQQGLDIKSAQEKLNQQKSDQIKEQKQAELQAKIEASNAKLEQAQSALQQRTDNAEAQLKAHKDYQSAIEERHKAEMAMKDHQFQTITDQHQQQIDALKKRLDQSGSSQTTTEMNADGTKKTVTTQKGSMITVKGKDGKSYQIPADKEEEWNSQHSPEQEQNNDESSSEE